MGPAATQDYSAEDASDEAARLKDVQEFVAARKAARKSNSEAMHEDLLMLKGGEDQWDPLAVRERKGKRPLYTGNRFPAMLAQITGEIRRNKPGISCKPGDASATPENAEIFEGIIRAIERLSQAPLAYARAGKSAAACGEGHLRIVPVREDDEGFDTGLRIRAIKNVHSVLWDAGAQAPDRSDANRCVVFSEVDRKGFEESYPQAGMSAWEKASAGFRQMEGWRADTGKVTVAEEWVVKREPYERYRVVKARPAQIVMSDGVPAWTDASQEETVIDGDVRKTHAEAITIDGVPEEQYLAALEAHGFEIVDRRTAYKKTICMYLWGGTKQIAGPIEWKGSRIPIFTVVGEEIDVGEETVTHGIIRHAKDAQRLFNYARSADLELVSQAPKAPIMVSDKQIDGWEDVWALAQRQPVPYLPYNSEPGVAAPQERNGPGTNPGPNSLSQAGITDMQDVVGIHDASLGKRSNETSGVAIEARDAQADTGTYVYLDNLNATIEAIGGELVAAIPHYYSAREQIMILGVDDAPAIVQMAGIKLDQGKYHVIAQRGPSYQSKREKAADLIAKTMNVAPPPAIPILFKTLFELSDVPDGDRISQEMTAAFVAAGLMPPPQQQGAMLGPGASQPGAPGGPQPMPGAPPSNVIPMPPRGGPPPSADPLADIAPPPVSPPGAPAFRQRVGPPAMAAPPGI